MINNYLQVLEDSLHKKKDVLERIEELCSRQEEMLRKESRMSGWMFRKDANSFMNREGISSIF